MPAPRSTPDTNRPSPNGDDARRPLFSVIIPTYNRAALVPQAVESVLAQTLSDIEIVVVDDGSDDGTAERLRRYGDRIRYVWQPNGGIAAARNRGIRESRGRYLAFLDSDDLFEPRMLETVHETFRRHPEAGGVVTAERQFDDRDPRGTRVFTKRSPGIHFAPAGLIAYDTHVGCGRPAVVRREWVDRLGGFDETIRCAVDCELWIRYSFHTSLVLQPRPLILRRKHASNLSDDRKQDAADWLEILRRIERDRPEFVRLHRACFRRSMAKNLLRFGRELLAERRSGEDALDQARNALRRAWRLRPWKARAALYLVWSYVAPSTYGRFRRWEMEHLRVP